MADSKVATLTDLRHFLGTPEKPLSPKEILAFVETLTPEELRELRNNPDVPHLDYWDVLDADERKYVDD